MKIGNQCMSCGRTAYSDDEALSKCLTCHDPDLHTWKVDPGLEPITSPRYGFTAPEGMLAVALEQAEAIQWECKLLDAIEDGS